MAIMLILIIISFFNIFSIINLVKNTKLSLEETPQSFTDKNNDIKISNEDNFENFTSDLEYIEENINFITLTANNTQQFAGTTNSSIIIDTKNWNFTAITLDIYDIWRFESQIIEDEFDDYGSVYEESSGKNFLAQGFNISAKYCELSEIEIQLAYRGSHTFFIKIYNASYNGTDYIPDKQVSISNQISLSSTFGTSGLRTMTFNQDVINKSETDGGIFFIIADGSFSSSGFFTPYVRWAYDADSGNGDAGSALLQISGNNWQTYEIDFYSSLEYTEFIFPEDVDMRVNNTNFGYLLVSNTNLPGEGYLSFSTMINNTDINLEIISDLNVNFNIDANIQLINKTFGKTHFKALHDSNEVNFNITLNALYFSGAFNQQLTTSIYNTWNINQVFINQSLINPTDWQKFANILNINSSSGWILIRGVDNNYINNISTIIDGSITDELYYNKNITVNATLSFIDSIIPVNLTLRNSSNQVEYQNLVVPIQSTISFAPYNLTKTGPILISTTWFNGTSMGFRANIYVVKYQTQLYNVSDNINESTYFKPGDDVFIDVYFNNTDLNMGIENASNSFTINMTSKTQYQINEDSGGYYNITIYTDQLSDRNHTFKIMVDLFGYQTSSILVKFKVFTTAFTNFNITGYYGNQYIAGKWWVYPNPYFDDDTRTIQVQYQNATSLEGIYPALVYAYPNWTSDVWIGKPFDLTGEYDISINTEGLNEADKGEILIIASAAGFETQEIKIYLKIDKIPKNLLDFDITGYEEITVYEGETVSIAANFRDLFHDNDIIFDNPEEGNVTWSIPGTDASNQHPMERIIKIYVADIELPSYNIQGGNTYNITILGVSSENYETKTVKFS